MFQLFEQLTSCKLSPAYNKGFSYMLFLFVLQFHAFITGRSVPQLQDALDVGLVTQTLVHKVRFHLKQSRHQLTSRCLVRPAADDDFVICRNTPYDKCLCQQANVQCILQLMMTLLYVEAHCMDKCLCCQTDVQCVLRLMMTLLHVKTYLMSQCLCYQNLRLSGFPD